MDIQFNSVLSNLAKMSVHPECVPSHVHLADGVVQVNDQAGFGQSGGFTTFGGSDFGIDRFGPSAQRRLTEQWGTDATTDPERLYDLQQLYRVALGLSPLPPPNAIAYLRRDVADKGLVQAAFQSGSGSSDGGSQSGSGSSGNSSQRGPIPLEILLTDVPPPGWYGLGDKDDVPEDACYIGHYGCRYAWVTPCGMAELTQFTISVLAVIRLSPDEAASTGGGLAVTGPS